MTAATYFDLPHERRPWWAVALEIIGVVEPPKKAWRRSTSALDPVEAVTTRPPINWDQSDFRPKEPVGEPHPPLDEPPPLPVIKFDAVADLKARLRALTYGEFMEAAAGMGFTPQAAWAWATA